MNTTTVHPVDEILPAGRLTTLGVQHVLVMVVVMIESTGMFLALSDITGKKINQNELTAGLRTDGLGTLIGGIFNTFPYTSFSQNVGLVGVTGVRSRYVCVAGGIIMIILGLLPKMSALVESIPQFVLGGAGLGMFGMVKPPRQPRRIDPARRPARGRGMPWLIPLGPTAAP